LTLPAVCILSIDVVVELRTPARFELIRGIDDLSDFDIEFCMMRWVSSQ